MVCVTVDCRDPRRVAEFWAEVLDWRVAHVTDDGAVVEAPDRNQPYLEFIVVPEPKTLKNRVHLGLSTAELDLQIERLGRDGRRGRMGGEVPARVAVPQRDPPRPRRQRVLPRNRRGTRMTHDVPKPPLKASFYEKEMARLQRELVKLQEWVQARTAQGVRALRGP